MTICDHTPDGELRAHIEVWRTDEGWSVIAFARPELMPECVAECDGPGPALEVAAQELATSVTVLDGLLTEAA